MYSLAATSAEEETARDFICFGRPDVTVVVADATCLERNLNLVLQVMELTPKVVVCLNLLDEAKRKNISINIEKLSESLNVPVIGTNARKKEGFKELKDAIYKTAFDDKTLSKPPLTYCSTIEEAVEMIRPLAAESVKDMIDARWVSLKILEGDKSFLASIENHVNISSSTRDRILRARSKALSLLKKACIDIDRICDIIVTGVVRRAEDIASDTVLIRDRGYDRFDRAVDSILTSRIYGIPIMAGLLGVIFWLTITGANYPSSLLADMFSAAGKYLSGFLLGMRAPSWLNGLLIEGVYRTLTWVVSVMLPPMAIFFPLFTFLEDIGYLPRVAFNMDSFFKKACAHGKQALTMCMGFGCNAAGVTGCRIIDSPRERLIAILTNCYVPCNGRFPILITLSSIFLGGAAASGFLTSLRPVIAVFAIIAAGVAMTLVVSWVLSHTILKGVPSSFALEMPPYRKPQLIRIIVRSILDRTLFVLARAAAIAAPAGLLIWILANVTIGDESILSHCAAFLDPPARLLGMDGYILMAFILGIPANEIVLPVIIMSYMSTGVMVEPENLISLYNLLASNGWTWLTALCVMLFSLMHFPCGTTLWTIKKETGSIRYTLIAFALPLATGLLCCFFLTQAVRLFGI
jgi:ferrous iron transport protein B